MDLLSQRSCRVYSSPCPSLHLDHFPRKARSSTPERWLDSSAASVRLPKRDACGSRLHSSHGRSSIQRIIYGRVGFTAHHHRSIGVGCLHNPPHSLDLVSATCSREDQRAALVSLVAASHQAGQHLVHVSATSIVLNTPKPKSSLKQPHDPCGLPIVRCHRCHSGKISDC